MTTSASQDALAPARRVLSRRNLLGAAATGALVAGLSGCGLRGGSSPNTLNVLSLGDPFFYAVKSLLPEFEAQTGIHVNLEGPDYDTLNARATNSFLTRQSDIDVTRHKNQHNRRATSLV